MARANIKAETGGFYEINPLPLTTHLPTGWYRVTGYASQKVFVGPFVSPNQAADHDPEYNDEVSIQRFTQPAIPAYDSIDQTIKAGLDAAGEWMHQHLKDPDDPRWEAMVDGAKVVLDAILSMDGASTHELLVRAAEAYETPADDRQGACD